MVVIFMLISSTQCQKSYSIASIVSNMTLTTNNDGCTSMKIVEDLEYLFNGSFSRVGRAFPYNVLSKIDSSSWKIEVLNSGYSISSQLELGSISSFIVSTLSPATPSNSITKLSIRMSFSAFPKLEVINSNSQLRYHYKDNAPISFISTTILFDSSFNSYPLNSSNGQLYIQNNSMPIVTFNMSNLSPNTEFQPMVSINSFVSKDCDSSHNTNENQYDKMDSSFTYGMVGGIVGFFVLLIVVTAASLVCVHFCMKKQFFKEKKKPKDRENPDEVPVSSNKEETQRNKPISESKPKVKYENPTSYISSYEEPTSTNYYSSDIDYSGGGGGWDSNTGGGCDYGGGGGGGCDYGGGGGGCDYGGSSGFAD
ncbi:predicted protein [Naegleria gruberi]|uniref:Predicted protein n=1 Tax=Naegleria gruberi TaxID=5762 RepID=D2VV11_NAEGR|nr:uncharacterized protein NAEGRDRAFT_52480 [Naegleria gruberi]EFC39359.1 predicted protein [Naegleria gruberi]|eukprot:XP_002672103.1 predicted protein [Naegleria gruberi strain NEG-M]